MQYQPNLPLLALLVSGLSETSASIGQNSCNGLIGLNGLVDIDDFIYFVDSDINSFVDQISLFSLCLVDLIGLINIKLGW
jgi:hypothetical protein